MRTLHSWTAKRAGGRITIYGKEPVPGTKNSTDTRIAGVDKIEGGSAGGGIFATVKTGEVIKLLV